MTKKIFGTKQITHLIYGILMMFPFLAILSKCVYVVCNKNAKDSYYGETINEEINYYYNGSQLITNEIYTLNYYQNDEINFTGLDMYVYDVNYIETNIVLSQPIDSYYMFRIEWSNNTISKLYLFYGQNSFDNKNINAQNYLTFKYLGKHKAGNYVQDSDKSINYSVFEQKTYNRDSYLDNVFEYSVESFTKENGNFNINFFGWFDNLFLTQSGHNLIYLNFANWYLNYALLVSVGYILFLLLLWFINYVRKILEGGNSFGHGGF